jgi:hypothetical protein
MSSIPHSFLMRFAALFVLTWLLMACQGGQKAAETTTAGSPPTTTIPTVLADTIKEKTDTVIVSPVGSQTFTWQTELCQNTGTYDAGRYSEQQLINTHELWFSMTGIEADPIALDPADLPKTTLDKLSAQYRETKRFLSVGSFVDGPFWDKLRADRLAELEADYRYKTLALEAYDNPSVLLTDRSPASCRSYAQALAGDEVALLTAWRDLVAQQRQKNGSTASMDAKYERELKSADRLRYARTELMAFGWWNCVNEQIPRVSRTERMETEFNKLFSKIKKDCDEP